MSETASYASNADLKTFPQKLYERAFYSLPEVAVRIGCTRRFLENRIADGELKVFRPSRGLVRISAVEFDRWVESYSAKGTA